MPLPGTATAGGTSADTRGDTSGSGAPVPVVPFVRASQEHMESAGIDITRTMTASDQDLGTNDIPAYGYLRALIIVLTATSGSGTGVTLQEDGPWNALKNISVSEPNGAAIYQVSSGYSAMLIHKYGGYRGFNDPRSSPIFTTAVGTSMNFNLVLRIPLEISGRDALGSLPNQNSAATFKLRATLSAVGTVFAGTLTTPPSVRFRVFVESWDQPEEASAGMTNQVAPPSLNTTQFWSEQPITTAAGFQTLRLTRMGNYLRNLILVNRRAGTSRANGDTDFPDPLTWMLDVRPQELIERNTFKMRHYERYGYGQILGATTPAADSGSGVENGVFPLDFCHEFDQVVGHENRDLWLPTLGSTRFELQGTFANAGVLTVLTNDVTIASNVWL